jgi:hypothetical protein
MCLGSTLYSFISTITLEKPKEPMLGRGAGGREMVDWLGPQVEKT